MNRRFILILSSLLLLFSTTQAQQLRMLYDLSDQANGNRSLKIYLQSTTDQSVDIEAVNLSFAHETACLKVSSQWSMFEDSWSDFLQKTELSSDLELFYNRVYGGRLQYGIANPGLPSTAPLTIPAKGDNPLFVMEFELQGSCLDEFKLENESQNSVNQIGGKDLNPLDYVIEPLKPALDILPFEVQVYPNPMSETLNAKLQIEKEGNYNFQLLDMTGRSLMQKTLALHGGAAAFSFDVKDLAEGTYLLKVTSETNSEVTSSIKVLKK